jgi:hypothetical protein
MFEDHWVCEYWNDEAGRWVLADAQIDDMQRRLFGIDFDPLDVPRDGFVVAGQAWTAYRSGEADPASFGLSAIKESGDWWIAANLVRDVAALNNMEMLPWDVWGAMPEPGEPIGDDAVAVFDRLAALTIDPDFPRPQLTEMYESDDRLRVPPTVFNAARKRAEEVVLPGSGDQGAVVRLDHEGHERERTVVDLRGDLPASLAGEGDPGSLESGVPVAGRDIGRERRGRRVETLAGNREVPGDIPPPGKFPADGAVGADHARGDHGQAVQGERREQFPVAVERRARAHVVWRPSGQPDHVAEHCFRAPRVIGVRDRLGRRERLRQQWRNRHRRASRMRAR